MARVAVGTIVAKNYLAFARVLAGSIRERHPDVPFFVLLADEVDGRFAPGAEPFRLLCLADLAIPRLSRFQFHYSRAETPMAAKPYLLGHLLDLGFDSAVYLDADILVLGDLEPLFSRVSEHSVALTPHLLAPPAGEGWAARELNILLSGVYNGGFVGVSRTETARSFLAWWQDRLYGHCREALPQGLHYDQRWLDLVPPFFEDVHVLRDPACNVAYWNLPERDVRLDQEAVLVNGRPCRFFHFSGFDPDRPLAVTRHSPHLTTASLGPVAALFQRYRTLLEAAGHHESKTWPYAYDRFDNGVPIPDLARQVYGNLGDAAEPLGDPFRTAPPSSYFRWLNQAADDSPRGITRLWQAVYEQRVDVQRAYPDLFGADREAFLAWAAHHGAREHGIPEGFVSA